MDAGDANLFGEFCANAWRELPAFCAMALFIGSAGFWLGAW
jgi:hypothetical protein